MEKTAALDMASDAGTDAAICPSFALRVNRRLKRDEIRMNRHRALDYCLSMIFPENRCALFRIML
ncbi:hypothetical protein [Bradyrhizobium sp. B117]|uniref:hypothetical protein n=1 Tax=Bradyrhizobium sp. B117 TaxID=3140246 RepID=UPI003184522E